MTKRRRALVTAATIAGTALSAAALVSSAAATSPSAADKPELTETSCEALGGEYAVTKDTKTCTVTTLRTFTGVEDGRLGPFEADDAAPEEEPVPWVNYAGHWQSAQDVEFTTVLTQKALGPIREKNRQEVVRYFDFEMAVCMRTAFDEDGYKLGGGLMDTNVPCKSRDLMPDSAPDEMLEAPWLTP